MGRGTYQENEAEGGHLMCCLRSDRDRVRPKIVKNEKRVQLLPLLKAIQICLEMEKGLDFKEISSEIRKNAKKGTTFLMKDTVSPLIKENELYLFLKKSLFWTNLMIKVVLNFRKTKI